MAMEEGYNPRHAGPRRAAESAEHELSGASDLDAEEWLDWFCALPDPDKADHRDDLLCEGLAAGVTLQDLGNLYGISRERVRQITQRRGLNAMELRAERRARSERRYRRIARRVYGMSLSYPELTVEEIADAVECDVSTVIKALGNRRGVHLLQEKPSSPKRVSDEDLLAGLAEWAKQTTHMTGDDYTEWASEHSLPGKQTIHIRFGSWNTALALAGVGGAVDNRGGLRPHLDDAVLWATLYEFFTSDAASFSVKGYDEWARANDRASLATLRNRLGMWSELWGRTRELMRYAADRDGSSEWAEEVLQIVPGEVERKIISQDQCLAAVKRVADATTGAMTVQLYERERTDDEPAAIVVAKKCGSWIHALHQLGLDFRMSGKAKGKIDRGEVVLD